MVSKRQIQMDEITDPGELAAARKQHEQFDRNSRWLEANASIVFKEHRGRHICVAGKQLFVGDTAQAALAEAEAAHPDDRGCLLRYIPRECVPRIYANRK